MRKLLTVIALSSALLVSAHSAVAQVSVGVRIGPPPAPRAYVVPAQPGPNYAWVEGYWVPQGAHYRWHNGHWAKPPYQGAYWAEPYYSNGHYYRGHWDGAHAHANSHSNYHSNYNQGAVRHP